MKACVMLTCFNRKDKTVNCIKSLVGNNKADFDFIVVDDGSMDGTTEAIIQLKSEMKFAVEILRGNGKLFYSGGMKLAMEAAQHTHKADIYVLINDDGEFEPGVIDEIGQELTKENAAKKVIVGAMKNSAGDCSYGGIRYTNGIHYVTVKPDDEDRSCDTFNANFVAIPAEIFADVPVMDGVYKHSLGDFDYGLQIKKKGYAIEVSDHFLGVCDNNSKEGTWLDTSLPRFKRWWLKGRVKGAPLRQWFHFLNKNFGFHYALVYSMSPYVRIICGK